MNAVASPTVGSLGASAGTADWLVAESLRPITEGELAPFYDAAAHGRLAMPFCGACDSTPLELDQTACDVCASQTIVWRDVEMCGVVHTATTVHRLEPGLVLTSEPYHVVDIDLPSGHRLLMTTTTPTATAPTIGSAVTIGFRRVGGVNVPAIHVPAIHVPAVNVDPHPTRDVGTNHLADRGDVSQRPNRSQHPNSSPASTTNPGGTP
jgi:uncharacterized protein